MTIYHGVRQTCSGCLYQLGLALFDMENPSTCLLRGEQYIFSPEEPYERFGDVNNVVFPCGVTLARDGNTLHTYYGATDTCIGLATGSLRALMDWLPASGKPFPPRGAEQSCADEEPL